MHTSLAHKYEGSWEILTVDAQASDAPQKFCQSLHETGFAVIRNHRVPLELCQHVLKDWQGYFRRSEEDKQRDHFAKDPATSGWYPYRSENSKGYPVKNLMEFFHYRTTIPLPEGIGEETLVLFRELTQLSEKLLTWLDQSLPKEIHDDLHTDLVDMSNLYAPCAMLRLIHYPALADRPFEPGAVRSSQHEDITLLSLLCGATAPGLEVLDTQGNWHPVESDFSDIVVNAGDMLQMATRHYLKSTTHRVVNPTGADILKPRYSMPFFVGCKPHVRLSETHTAQDYFDERMREVGFL